LVAGLIVLEDELITFANVLREASPKDIAGELAKSGPYPLVIERDLLRRAVEDQVKRLLDIGVVTGPAFLTGSVRENDDILRHALFPPY